MASNKKDSPRAKANSAAAKSTKGKSGSYEASEVRMAQAGKKRASSSSKSQLSEKKRSAGEKRPPERP